MDHGRAEVLGVLELLASTDGARGHERGAAEVVADHAARSWPAIEWRVEPVDGPDGPCAQLVGAAGGHAGHGDLLLYSHLDTSLTGDPAFDEAITGRAEPAHGYRLDPVAGTVRAPGLGVARGPAAAALVGFARAATALAQQPDGYGLRLLLAARGTHRAADWDHPGADAPPTTGVSSFLARNSRPGAAVVAKGGPDGVLYDEPGASYLRVRARAPWGAVMSRGALRPEGGVLAHLGVLTDAVEVAGAALAAAAPTSAQAGAQFGIGAIRSGQPVKPDLAPGLVDLYCYFVSPGELTPGRAADALAGRTRALLAGTVLADVEVTVVEQVVHGGASTDAQAPVVRAAVAAYREVHDCVPPAVSGWTGSTDGIVLRAAGVPTVRVGPWRTVALGDGSDVVAVDDLVALVRVYERIARTLGPRAPMSHLT